MTIKDEIKEAIKKARIAYEEAKVGVEIMEKAGEDVRKEKAELEMLRKRIEAYENALV